MATWAYIENGEIKDYCDALPDNWKNISNFFALSTEIELLKTLGWYFVIHPQYTYNSSTQKLDNRRFVIGEGTVTEEWDVVDIPPPPPPPVPTPEEIQNLIVQATQKRLDDFAKTRNYDGILSACSYIDDPYPKFQTEGQYCVTARSQTWLKLYEIQTEVQQGLRPMPTKFSDIEGELPVLVWPEWPPIPAPSPAPEPTPSPAPEPAP